jgi:SAM-dependent methyltransferase
VTVPAGNSYTRFFDEHHEWGAPLEALTPGQRARVQTLVELVPDDAETVLDVGCGDGVVTNLLVGRGINATGADISRAALAHVRAPTLIASADDLPVDDRSYDCILASNVLEHLPYDSFERTVAEFERVARRYLLLSFPHREDLALMQVRCRRCLSTFHASRHVRSIELPDLEEWFPAFTVTEHRLTGDSWQYRSRKLQRLAQLTGNVWFTTPVTCPTCGYDAEPPPANKLIWTLNGAGQRAADWMRPGRPSQLIALLRRQG